MALSQIYYTFLVCRPNTYSLSVYRYAFTIILEMSICFHLIVPTTPLHCTEKSLNNFFLCKQTFMSQPTHKTTKETIASQENEE